VPGAARLGRLGTDGEHELVGRVRRTHLGNWLESERAEQRAELWFAVRRAEDEEWFRVAAAA
jgi:hypothetical protein